MTLRSFIAMSIIGAGIPPLILVLLAVVVVIPFVLPPVKNWRSATPQERFSVVMYTIAVIVLVLYFLVYFG